MPLEFRRLKLKMRYWINIKGHSDSHPIKKVLKNCWEYEYKTLSSFGWTANEEAQSIGLSDIKIAPSVATSAIPPWLFPMPVVDTTGKERSILTSGGPLSALTCCVNVRLLSAIKKISPLIYSQSWVGSWVYTTQAMMTFTLIF